MDLAIPLSGRPVNAPTRAQLLSMHLSSPSGIRCVCAHLRERLGAKSSTSARGTGPLRKKNLIHTAQWSPARLGAGPWLELSGPAHRPPVLGMHLGSQHHNIQSTKRGHVKEAVTAFFFFLNVVNLFVTFFFFLEWNTAGEGTQA